MSKNISPDTAPAEAPKKKFSPLKPSDVKLAESTNNTWRAVVPRGTTREDLLVSDLWSVMAHNFLSYDRINIVSETREFFAELLVIDAGRGYCSLVELSFTPLPAIIVANNDVPSNHSIEHCGPEKLYIVRRLSDGVILGEGFPSRDAALAHLISHASLR
jgi:hypothetical protein